MEKETRKRKGVVEESLAVSVEDDICRVRTPLTDSVVVVTATMINTELTCPICLGIIRNCTTVMECLHRFCLDCIEKSLRLGRKQCPSCRVACPSRRNLRQDTNFDALVAKIYPDIKKAEATLQKLTLSVIKAQNHGAFAKAMEDGMFKQKEKSRRGYVELSPVQLMPRPVVHSEPSPPPAASPSNQSESRRRNAEGQDQSLSASALQQLKSTITVLLYRRADFQQTPALTKFRLRTTRLLTIDQLQRYVALKLESKQPIAVYGADCAPAEKSKHESLSANLTLGAVDITIWKKASPMILFFAGPVS